MTTRFRPTSVLCVSKVISQDCRCYVWLHLQSALCDTNNWTQGSNDSHQSFYSWNWLQTHRPFRYHMEPPKEPRFVIQPEVIRFFSNLIREWEHADPLNPSKFPTVDYNEVMSSDSGVAKWTDLIVRSSPAYHSPPILTPKAPLRLLLCLKYSCNSLRHRVSDPTYRIHPRNPLWRLLGLHLPGQPH